MRFGEFCFRLRLIPTLAVVMLVPLFIALGIWQLDRAAFKRRLAATIDARIRQPALELRGTLDETGAALQYGKVRVHGRFEPEHQVFLENRKYHSRIGYQVITPLKIGDTGMRVLVNRGWVPMPADRASLPAVDTPTGPVEVHGTAEVPSPPALVLEEVADAADGPAHWPYLTVERFTARVDYPLLPVVILQAPDDAGGFVREWPRRRPSEGMHIGYAIQWFAFALIAVLIYLRLSWSRDACSQGAGC